MFSVIISPAKKMRCDPDSLEYTALPEFTEKSEKLLKILKSMSYAELKTLWQCNDKIAGENFDGTIESHTTLFSGTCPKCMAERLNRKLQA